MDGDPRWLALATDLGNRLLPAFDSPTGMPYVRVNLATGATEGSGNNPAEIGTLTLEFGMLSRLTGDPRYVAYGYGKLLVAPFRRRPWGCRSPVLVLYVRRGIMHLLDRVGGFVILTIWPSHWRF